VAAGSVQDCPQPADLLLGYLDRVEPALADVEREAPKFADGVADTIEQPGVLFHQVLRTVIAAALLVTQDEE
jgi:hypothetical protein